MAIQTINIGNSANDGNGEPARSAFNKVNQNFTNNAHAASRLVGTSAGNVMEVGAFGLGANNSGSNNNYALNLALEFGHGFFQSWSSEVGFAGANEVGAATFFITPTTGGCAIRVKARGSDIVKDVAIRSSQNTTVDSNGFIKAASPIVQLYSDKIELNDEAKEQSITFKRVDVGQYLIKGSSGFATEGWYIEQPKDANGNLYHVVEIETRENGDLDIKTYDYMLDKKGRIVADHDTPLDIQEGRWIDIRLQEILKPDVEVTADDTSE